LVQVTADAAFKRFAATVAKTDPGLFAVDNYHFRTQGFFLSGPGAALPSATRPPRSLRRRRALPGDSQNGGPGAQAVGHHKSPPAAPEPPLLSAVLGELPGGRGPSSWLPFRRAQLDFLGRVEQLQDDWDAVRGHSDYSSFEAHTTLSALLADRCVAVVPQFRRRIGLGVGDDEGDDAARALAAAWDRGHVQGGEAASRALARRRRLRRRRLATRATAPRGGAPGSIDSGRTASGSGDGARGANVGNVGRVRRKYALAFLGQPRAANVTASLCRWGRLAGTW
jgi:hypothetical protein